MSKPWPSYKQQKVAGAYDVIVIGSGLGGMSTAALLSKMAGKKVLVLEKHYVAGGFTHTFKRKDYEWDVGLHYVGEVNREKTFLRRLFNFVTDGELKWAEMDPVYDRMIFGREQFDFVKGKNEFLQKMKEYFPGEEEALEKYVSLVYKSARSAGNFFVEKAIPPFLGNLIGFFLRRPFLRNSDRTTLEVLQGLTGNKKLIGVLAGQYGDYGLPPSSSSFAIHSMVAKHYMNGAAFPVGGSQRISETIYPVIKRAGGEVFVNAGVKEIIIRDNKAVGVQMEDGTEIFAPLVISNAGIENTWRYLVNEKIALKHGMAEKLKQVNPSVSHVCLYIGIKESWKNLGLGNANLWIYPHFDHDQAVKDFIADPSKPFPVVYISFPSGKDPDWENRYPGKSTIEIITLAPFGWFKKWEGEKWKKRGEEYEKLKEDFSQRLLGKLYEVIPALRGKVNYYELSSPLSTKHFTSYMNGEIYGIDHNPNRFRQKFLNPGTPVKNLFLTGQDVVTAGIGGALIAGLITASSILKNPGIVKKILKSPENQMA